MNTGKIGLLQARSRASQEKGEHMFSADIESLREENARLQRDLTRALEERNRLLKKIADPAVPSRKQGGSRVLEERLEETRGELERLRKERFQLEEKVRFLREKLVDTGRISGEFLVRMEEIVGAIQGESISGHIEVLNASEAADQVVDRFNAATETLWRLLESNSVFQNRSLRDELSKLKATLENQQDETLALNLEKKRLAESLASMESSLEESTSDTALRDSRIESLRKRLQELEEENRRIAKINLKLKSQVKDLRGVVDPETFGYLTSHRDSTAAGDHRGMLARYRSGSALMGFAAGALLSGAGLWLSGQVIPAGKVQPRVFDQPVPAVAAPVAAKEGDRDTAPDETGEATPATAPAASAVPPAARTVRRDRLNSGGLGPRLVEMTGGVFTMGTDRYSSTDLEKPARLARTDSFFIASHEVTFDDYDAFARATGRALPDDQGWGRGKRPVINVSWDDAKAYAEWLTRQTGKPYRLPSEVEWEFAMAGGFKGIYWWGNEFTPGQEVCFNCGTQWDGKQTAPVGSASPNRFGLYDMGGNVMEWVQDCLPAKAGAGAEPCAVRVARGGAFNKPDDTVRTTFRRGLQAHSRYPMVGFRVARER
jgi:formylglycine-generating enzyme required for sulfatase activity